MSWLMPSQSGPPPARAVLIHPFVRLDVSQLPGSPKKRKIEGEDEDDELVDYIPTNNLELSPLAVATATGGMG